MVARRLAAAEQLVLAQAREDERVLVHVVADRHVVGVGADPQRAMALYLEAAKAGDLSAGNNLGELYETGRGVPVDGARASEYYKAAAEAGFAPAQFNLGRLYAGGTVVARDTDKARLWLTAALKNGVQPAQKILDWLDTQPAPGR